MDKVSNPFSPGAGTPPYELVGRGNVLELAELLLQRTRLRRSEKSLLLTGLRGVGKTVLLNHIEAMAKKNHYYTIMIESYENKPLLALLIPYLKKLLSQLQQDSHKPSRVFKWAVSVLASLASSIKLTVDETNFGIHIDPAPGYADSGDLETDLPECLLAIAEAASDQSKAVAIFIDELQLFTAKELSALTMSMHKIQQKQQPMILIGAGLPILPALAGESKSYAERLFNFPQIGALNSEEVFQALEIPAQSLSASFTKDAAQLIYQMTLGYPYFVQVWGYTTWNIAAKSPISVADVKNASNIVIDHLDKNFFRVRFDRLTPSEKKLLRAMAELGPGPYSIQDIARILSRKVSSLSPIRKDIIKKGMVFSPEHGQLAFTVPLFDQFMKRSIPRWPE